MIKAKKRVNILRNIAKLARIKLVDQFFEGQDHVKALKKLKELGEYHCYDLKLE